MVYAMTGKWLFYSLLALVLWGVWGAVLKYASRGLSWQQLYFFSGLATTTIVILLGLSNAKRLVGTSLYYALLGIVAGFFGTLGYIAMIKALEAGGRASVVVPLTSLYPAITVVLAWAVLKEQLTPSRVLGILFALLAIYLFSRP